MVVNSFLSPKFGAKVWRRHDAEERNYLLISQSDKEKVGAILD